MIRFIIPCLLLILSPFFIVAQDGKTFEVQADKVDSITNIEIQIFYQKFNEWIASVENDSVTTELDAETMVDNFIIFSEDGLIMKDLDFHSVESCKKEILDSSPIGTEEPKWIYVSLESQVNKSELIEILQFLKEQEIEYQFGKEDEFVPGIINE